MSASEAATVVSDVKAAAAEADDNIVTHQVESEPTPQRCIRRSTTGRLPPVARKLGAVVG
ncbi:MAG: hypothetical protein V5A56_02200 [Halolamina sp.]